MARKSAAPARLPMTLPTTLGVARGLLSFDPPVSELVGAVVSAGAGAVLTGPPPPPPRDVDAAGSDEVADICVDDCVDENDEDEEESDDMDVDEVLFSDEKKDEDSMVLEDVELKPIDEASEEETAELLLDVAVEVDVGEGEVDVERTAVGTPDGHGYAGTVRSLGKGGTAGTEGNTTVGNACTFTRPGVEVARPMTFPLASTVATTSTMTVKTFEGSTAGRRWNMRCARPMTARPFCSRINSGSSTSSGDSGSSSCSCPSLGSTSWARWR